MNFDKMNKCKKLKSLEQKEPSNRVENVEIYLKSMYSCSIVRFRGITPPQSNGTWNTLFLSMSQVSLEFVYRMKCKDRKWDSFHDFQTRVAEVKARLPSSDFVVYVVVTSGFLVSYHECDSMLCLRLMLF